MPTNQTLTVLMDSVDPSADPTETIRSTAPAHLICERLPPISYREHTERNDGEHLILDGTLGHGGMGVVRLARQPHLTREVAVKQLQPHAAQRAADALTREARTMAELDHPNIIPVHDLGMGPDGRPILIMKRIDSVTWRTLLAKPNHPRWASRRATEEDTLSRNIEILLEVCSAISYAHQKGVLHLDLKPENILIGEHGQVYVADWGLASRVGKQVDHIVGTPAYLAPDLVNPGQVLGPTTDVFGLGAMLHTILTGQPRYLGTDVHAVLVAAVEAAPYTYGPDAPVGLATLCTRATAKRPADRHPDVGHFVADLMSWRRHVRSEQLTAAARRYHGSLTEELQQPTPRPLEVANAFAAARFGYREALDRWPDNTEARIGLVDALQVMARYALHREETDRVASHVDELASLHVEVHTLRGAVEEIHRRRQDESQRLWDGDYGVGHRPRILLLATIATFSAGVLVFALFKDPTTTTHSEILAFGVAINLVIWVAIWLLRPKLLRNQINRAIAWMIAVVAATVVVHRALAWMEPSIHSVGETLADDMLLVGFTVVVGALFTSWRLAPFGVLFIGGGCLAHMRPDLGILTASLMSAIGPIVVAALMLLDRTPPEDSPPLHP